MRYLFIKLTQYLLYQKEERGFTLIELLVVVILMGILTALALPNYFNQIEKARVAEAKQNLGSINRAQQAYYFEKAVFAAQMSNLGVNLTLDSELYQYSIPGPVNNTEVHHLAKPQPTYASDINTVVSAVYRIGDGFKSVLCEGNDPSANPNIADPTTCNDGEIVGK